MCVSGEGVESSTLYLFVALLLYLCALACASV